jgi:hypothetical protein
LYQNYCQAIEIRRYIKETVWTKLRRIGEEKEMVRHEKMVNILLLYLLAKNYCPIKISYTNRI